MAKLTGQFTTPSLDAQNNKAHKPFQHGVVFIFTGATKVVKETDSKGKYSFDLANGEYEVSVYLKGNTEKDRFDMRAGEKFTVTATTQADALEKWLQVIGTNGKDELATYYENLLVQMQKVANDFKQDTEFVGTGKITKESGVNLSRLKNLGIHNASAISPDNALEGDFGLYNVYQFGWYHISTQLIRISGGNFLFQSGYSMNGGNTMFRVKNGISGLWSPWSQTYNTTNTTVDSNGNLKAASPIIKLFSDHIESNDSFKEKPSLEKLGTGAYKISNTLGLAKEGWYIETPKDKNGLPYFMVDWEQDEESQDVIIRVFKKKLDLETLDFVNGDPVDIGQDQRWIDLRFHEPQEVDDEELLTQLDNLDESAH